MMSGGSTTPLVMVHHAWSLWFDHSLNYICHIKTWTQFSPTASVQFNSVTEFMFLITKIMMAALTHSNCEETFQFSAGQRIVRVRVSVMTPYSPAADCITCSWSAVPVHLHHVNHVVWWWWWCSMLMGQWLKSFEDRSQLFLSVAQPGHPDLPSANGDV